MTRSSAALQQYLLSPFFPPPSVEACLRGVGKLPKHAFDANLGGLHGRNIDDMRYRAKRFLLTVGRNLWIWQRC